MRSLIRIVGPVLAVIAIALGGASSAVAASSPSSTGAAGGGWNIDDAWCNGDESFMICFEISGHVQLMLTGKSSGIVINQQEHADFYVDGSLVAETDEFTHERFAVNANDVYTTHVVTHTRVGEGDTTCQYQVVYRIVDFDVVTDHEGGTCG
jgi:hypothetical protein